MTTKTVTTTSGKIIKVELVRKVQDKVSYADGYNIVVGREIVEYTNITFCDASGKTLASGKEVSKLYPQIRGSRDAEMMAKGAVAKVGDAYVTQGNLDLIKAALAELDAENPKSAEQLAIEAAKAEAYARWEAELPAMRESEEFERRMDRADSDL